MHIFTFSKLTMTSQGNHANHCLFNMILLLLLLGAASIPNLNMEGMERV